MKITCNKILNVFNEEVKDSPYISLGKTYDVLSIYINNTGKIFYSILNDTANKKFPDMSNHQADCFEVVDFKIPTNWRVWVDKNGIGICPLAWQSVEFVEKLENRDVSCLKVFNQELLHIMDQKNPVSYPRTDS